MTRVSRCGPSDSASVYIAFADVCVSMVLILSVLLAALQLSSAKATEDKNKMSVVLGKSTDEKAKLSALLTEAAEERNKLSKAKMASVERTVQTRELNFATGSAVPEITAGLPDILEEVTRRVSEGYRRIRVEGHTDNMPIDTTRFPSNWELSSARAVWLARHIESHLPTLRETGIIVEAIGYGDRAPIADNATAEGRRRNRRINIRFER